MEEKKFQFYVFVGYNNYVSQNPYKACICLRNDELTNYERIRKRLVDLYGEKAKYAEKVKEVEGIDIGFSDKIIFVIADEKYRSITEEIMSKVGINKENGVIFLAPRKTNVNTVSNNSSDNNVNVVKPINNGDVGVVNNSLNNTVDDNRKDVVDRDPTMVFSRNGMVVSRNGEPFEGNDTNTGGSPRSYDGSVKVEGKVKTLKKAAFVSLPVLIFIISTILLIASFVLLFVMD